MDLFIDDGSEIMYSLNPDYAVGVISFSSDDSDIVGVDSASGDIMAKAEGSATITVSFSGSQNYAPSNATIKVNVKKIATKITVNSPFIDVKVNVEADTGASLEPANAGNLTYESSDENIVKIENDKVKGLKAGNATITVSFAGDDKYLPAKNKTISVTVTLNDASVRVENDTLDLFVDDSFDLVATVEPKYLTVNFTSSNISVVTVNKEGKVVAVSEGTAVITLEVGDGEIYAKNSTNVTVTVSKIHTEISIEKSNVTLNIDDEVSTGAALNPEEAGNLTYKSGDKSVAIVKDGKIMALKEGNVIITVSFKGNNKYAEAENKTIEVTVKKLNPGMDITAEDITEGENATISVTLPIYAAGIVTTEVNGKTYSSPVENGKAIITIPDLVKGDYTLPVTYSGDDKYNSSTGDVNFTVKEDKIIVSAPDLTKYYSGHESFIVNVTYARGVPIAGKEVKITINGLTYTRTTDENGTASLNINLNSKTYDVTSLVDNITVDSRVTILPTIEAEDVVFKSKKIVFAATFLDGEGNYLAEGTNVSFIGC